MKVALVSPALISSKSSKMAKILRDDFRSRGSRGSELHRKLEKGDLTVRELCFYVSGAGYFTSKLRYAERFFERQLIITPSGLLPPDYRLSRDIVNEWMDIDLKNPEEFKITRDMMPNVSEDDVLVLIGSVEYLGVFDREAKWNLFYPRELRGKGNAEKSRILRNAVETGRELTYEPVEIGGPSDARQSTLRDLLDE